uniref:NADH-ubiquinone oxidoreductase chain 5 n=1 Tax=Loxosomella aloxiata TaxID=393182 RepID=B1B1X5_9BILA|nr:NADH dehydrogenase subunit 5 [Loxosomella aloxiata]BAG12590.1 NADH dehydrogenase subunit 5 [Loxosomella aloxiata]
MLNSFKKIQVFWYKILYLFSFIMFVLFMFFSKSSKTYILEFVLFDWNSISFSFPLIIDSISLSFSSVMLFISGSVMMFSNYYMEGEKFMNRFSILILLFILSMNFLIFVPNLITLLMGWDGLGIVSLLLVIFYQNSKSLGAGMITFMSNRVGDALLIISIGWMISMGSWNIYFTNFSSGFGFVLWCVVIAAMTKSAQIPFSAWLPAAMAAPTPVSALVHSSTLVTVGIYLLVRFYDQIFIIPSLSWYILNIGTLTTLMAGMSAVSETDLKKIIALSTLSQLGVMMFSLGLGLKELCIFHLYTHALFKALLFICAGGMIHSHSHLQDVRKLGSVWYFMPITTSCLNIANLSLCGFPFLSGFYSKDLILESMLENQITSVTLSLMVVATFLTTLYSARLTFLSVIKNNNFFPMSSKLEENDFNVKPMVLMTLVSIMSGPSLYWVMNSEVLEPNMNVFEKLLPLILILSAIVVVFSGSKHLFMAKNKMMLFYSCSNMWFIAPLSSQPVIMSFMKVSQDNIKLVDQGWNETLGGQGLFKISSSIFRFMSIIQMSKVNVFVGLMVLNLLIVIKVWLV